MAGLARTTAQAAAARIRVLEIHFAMLDAKIAADQHSSIKYTVTAAV
jgi:hypothetical protein